MMMMMMGIVNNSVKNEKNRWTKTATVSFDWQGMVSYLCCVITVGLGGTVVELKAVKVSRRVIPNNNNK